MSQSSTKKYFIGYLCLGHRTTIIFVTKTGVVMISTLIQYQSRSIWAI